MIGRAAQGRPRIFREIQHYLTLGSCCPRCLWQRLSACFARTFGNCMTFMVRQKGTELHVNTFPRYLREHAPNDQFRRTFNAIEDASEQLEALEAYFENFA